MALKLRPMIEFDPAKPAIVHDRLNEMEFEWEPERHGKNWREHGHRDFGDV